MTKTFDYVIYHGNCPDGITSLWCAKNYLESIDYVFTPIQCRAGKNPTINFTGKKVLYVDLCPDFNFLTQLCEIAKNVTILDHHKSALDMYTSNNESLESIENLEVEIDMERAGCQITWDYFQPTQSRPWFVNYVGDRDLWKWELPNSKEINIAMYKSGIFDPSNLSRFDDLLINPDQKIKNLAKQGKIIIDIQNTDLAEDIQRAVEAEFKHEDKTYKVWLLGNVSLRVRSELGNMLVNKNLSSGELPDFAVIWAFDIKSNEWWLSFRGGDNSPDLSIITRDLGGGGHKNAGGASIKGSNGIFKLFKVL